MGEVVALIRVMPSDILNDVELQNMMDTIKAAVKMPVKLGKLEVKDVAFGLRALNVTVIVPDTEGGVDPVIKILSKIDRVESVEVVDVGRL